MSLRKKQTKFARLVPRLIDKAFEMGYEVTIGDVFRDPRVHGPLGVKQGYGHRNSAHKKKMAIDLNLYKDGKYLDQTEDHRLLGEWWKYAVRRSLWFVLLGTNPGVGNLHRAPNWQESRTKER